MFVQINVFDEQKLKDDDVMMILDGLDLNNHQQVFRAVFDQVPSCLGINHRRFDVA